MKLVAALNICDIVIVAPVLVFNVQPPSGWLKLVALANIVEKVVTLLGVHPLIDGEPPLLNAGQLRNISNIVVAPLTFQLPMFWLKPVAFWNIPEKVVTLLTDHPLIDEEPPLLNAVVLRNIFVMFVTLLTFQLPMFWLKLVALRNICVILIVTPMLVFNVQPPSG